MNSEEDIFSLNQVEKKIKKKFVSQLDTDIILHLVFRPLWLS